MMGSPDNQAKLERLHEGPVRMLRLDAFLYWEVELCWEVFELFFLTK